MKLDQHIARFLFTVFIGSYSIGIFQSYLPAINDFVQHTFNEVEHIHTIHFENGKYHLHKEEAKINKNQNNKEQNQKTDALKKLDIHTNSTPVAFSVNHLLQLKETSFCFSKTVILSEDDTPHPPPQQLV